MFLYCNTTLRFGFIPSTATSSYILYFVSTHFHFINRIISIRDTMDFFSLGNDDAVDEDKLIICFGAGCANCSCLPSISCVGCSGKIGLCCLNCEVCLKPGAPCLPLGCCGPKCESDGCFCINAQVHCCCAVCSAALPCNEEVPVTLAAMGIMLYPKCGCWVKQSKIMER